jgi:Kef-type K+ transport system membrane component KefB
MHVPSAWSRFYSSHITSTHVANGLIAIVMVFVPFHAFLTVWGSTIFSHFFLLRLWDDIALGVLVAIMGNWLLYDVRLRRRFLSQPIVRVIAVYGLLTLLPVSNIPL